MDACKTSDWNGCLIHKNMCFHQLAWRMSPPVFSYQLTLLLVSYMRTFSHLTGCSVDDWQEESNQGVWNEKKKCHIHKSQFEVNPFKTVKAIQYTSKIKMMGWQTWTYTIWTSWRWSLLLNYILKHLVHNNNFQCTSWANQFDW